MFKKKCPMRFLIESVLEQRALDIHIITFALIFFQLDLLALTSSCLYFTKSSDYNWVNQQKLGNKSNTATYNFSNVFCDTVCDTNTLLQGNWPACLVMCIDWYCSTFHISNHYCDVHLILPMYIFSWHLSYRYLMKSHFKPDALNLKLVYSKYGWQI